MADDSATSVRMNTIEEALEAIAAGKLVIVVDDFDRENEGDLIGAAEHATAASVAAMLRHTTGVVCVPMPAARCEALDLPPMVVKNEDSFGTAFTVSCDLRHGTSTGISATDRAATIRALADPATAAADLTKPGHIFPLRARDGGVLVRGGHTEAGVDLVKAAGLRSPVSYICEICDNETYEMLRLPQLQALASALGLPLISIADLQRYRYRRERLVAPAAAVAPTPSKVDAGGDHDSNSPGAGGSTAAAAAAEGWPAPGGSSASSPSVRHHLRSIYNDNEYEMAVISLRGAAVVSAGTDGGAAATASASAGSSSGSVGLVVQFDAFVSVGATGEAGMQCSTGVAAAADVAWRATLQSAAASTSSGHDTVVCLRVRGDVRENVKGKEDAGVGGRHAHPAAAPASAAGHDAAVPSPTALRRQPSAYDSVFPLPPCLAAVFAPAVAAAGSSVDAAARAALAASYSHVCDRVSAETAQAVRVALAAPEVPTIDGSAASSVPSVTLLLQSGTTQPLPRVWEFGVPVAGVQAL